MPHAGICAGAARKGGPYRNRAQLCYGRKWTTIDTRLPTVRIRRGPTDPSGDRRSERVVALPHHLRQRDPVVELQTLARGQASHRELAVKSRRVTPTRRGL